MTLTVEIDPARRTAAFREVSYLAAGDSCRVVLDGVRGADFGTLKLMLYRDAASESPVASCASLSPVQGHPSLADGELALDTFEMAAWFADAVPEESDSDSDSVVPVSVLRGEPRLAARTSLAERSVRAEGWLVVSDSDRVWAACRVPVLLRPGAGTSGASDPSSIRALVSELVAGLVSAALADKADKVPSAAAGNLASLDASGNLLDSGATPASIKAAAVAEVVANAPGTMDTLKEIADILGSSQESGTVLKRISDLESGKADSSSLARVATSGSYADLSGRPTVPAVDTTLATQGAAADAKAVGDALRGGFTEWEFSGVPHGRSVKKVWYETQTPYGARWAVSYNEFMGVLMSDQTFRDATELTFEEYGGSEFVGMTATRHLITPKKTSQLTNDSGFITVEQVPMPDKIADTTHNVINADRTVAFDVVAYHWKFYDGNENEYDFTGTKTNSEWTNGTNKMTLVMPDGSHWTLQMYFNLGGTWISQWSETIEGTEEDNAMAFNEQGYPGVWLDTRTQTTDELTLKSYVDGKIGDIDTILDNINGEVI